jgi:GTPase
MTAKPRKKRPAKARREDPRGRVPPPVKKQARAPAKPANERPAPPKAKHRSKSKQHKRPAAPDGLSARKAVEPNVADLGTFRAGYVALVGRPNVGKSTILNQLLGQKIAATTHKPQTTRKNLLGILHPKGAQLLLLDTPGYHQAEGPLNRYMVNQARSAIEDADVIGYVVEARGDGTITPGNEHLIQTLAKSPKPVVLLVNKIDRLKDKTPLLDLIKRYREVLGERLVAAVPISAIEKDGLESAVRELAAALPEGSPLFPEDELTDQSERAIVAEMIREKVMLETKEELPYSTAVTIDQFEDVRPRLVRIFATIHVEKESQKGIVIGHRGERLKAIGTRARREAEHFLGSKLYLDLNVRVTEEWTTKPRALEMLGYVHDNPKGAGG